MAGEAQARWDVFSAEGARLGQVRLPASARVKDGERGWVLVVQLNDDDVPTVVKYTVRQAINSRS